jgi:hypothetical protein
MSAVNIYGAICSETDLEPESYISPALVTFYFLLPFPSYNFLRKESIVEINKFLSQYFYALVIQHCFIFRPSDTTVSEDAGIEPREGFET